MMAPYVDREAARRANAQEAIDAHEKEGTEAGAARLLGIPRPTFQHRLRTARDLGLVAGKPADFDRDPLPDAEMPVEQLLEWRKQQFEKKHKAERARQLIDVRVKLDGPVGIVHLGDPHVDDNGTDIGLLEKHCKLIRKTPGLLGANVGDLQNNWIGRLARLYAEQSTSAAQAWQLTEWLVNQVDWLYLIKGNHDLWTGSGDPLDWMRRGAHGVTEAWGARLNLKFPNGKQVRVNARHDFAGHSMWNTAHGPSKAAQMGWRDHVLTCGHRHTSGYAILKDPASGLISHALRVAGYKVYDRYAKDLGLPNQNITPAVVTIIDPRHEDDDPRLVTTINDVEEGAEYLAFKRKKAGA